MYAIGDVVVATKGKDFGPMTVYGLSSGGFYVHVKADGLMLTYPAKDLQIAQSSKAA
ncbi:hypothetical protein H4F18_04255 [Vibrio scophthalmi]|uniref:hypothetical protein n=1 Tax=Vibrio scophthalmi TaxID=45658 RepID=UPI002FF2ED3A